MSQFDFSEFVSLWGAHYGLWCNLASTMGTQETAEMLRCAARAFGGLDVMAAGTLARAMKRDVNKATHPPTIETLAPEGTRPHRIFEALEAARFPGWRREALEDWAMLSIGDMTTEAWPAAAALLSVWAREFLSIDMGQTEAAWTAVTLSEAASHRGRP